MKKFVPSPCSSALPVLFRAARLPCLLCLLFLSLCFPALGASLNWQALPDRERVTISMAPTEGLTGKVARIAPTGVLIPFTDVPPGLLVSEVPEGAAIFQGSKQQGRSLVLVTQRPEFGFMVSRQTPTELVIDFFHNALGARWKPTGVSPTTEVAPDHSLGPIAAPDEATRALESDPSGTSPETGALVGQPAAQTPAQIPAQTSGASAGAEPGGAHLNATTPATAQPLSGPSSGEEGRSTAATETPQPEALQPEAPAPREAPTLTRPEDADRPKPVVVQLSGSPEHASTATRMAEAPETAVPPSGVFSREAAFKDKAGATPYQPLQPSLDARTQTAERAAPLPEFEPPMTSLSSGGSGVTAPVDTAAVIPAPVSSDIQPAPVAAQPAPVTAQPAPSATQSPSSSGAAPALPPRVPDSVNKALSAATPQALSPQPQEAAPAPPAPPAPEGQERSPALGVGVPLGGSAYGGAINLGGLGDIPEDGFSAAAPSPAMDQAGIADAAAQAFAPQAPAGASAGGGREAPGNARPGPEGAGAPGQSNATVIYVDETGKPVEPPPDPLLVMPRIIELIRQDKYRDALDLAALLLEKAVLTNEQKEELLHIKAEMLFAVNKDNLAEHYREITDAANQAMSFNPRSRRNAADLLRLGYMNLKLNNIPEAEARFSMLRKQFPDDENVPLTYYYWGDYYFGRNELQRAADEFQYVLQEFPNSRIARESALGLARAFYRMGYYEQAFNVVDYIERRWERFYVQYPPFLNMMGDVGFRLNRLDYALKHYWLYVNLEPMGPETDIILTRIGDIYAMQREKEAARELYRESMNRFPDRDGGLVAMMRLAEEGMNDDPTISGMFAVYDAPYSLRPVEVYRRIIEDHPESSLVPLAKIKLALWHLWNKEYEETLARLSEFIEQYPKHELAPRAREIAAQTFAVLSAESMKDERYGRMRDIWERYPVVREQGEALSPESRIALGVSYRDAGNANEALRAVEPFFLGSKIPEYSEMALSLVLSIYLEHNQWESVREVARRVALWELKPESSQQLDYALALAAENLGEPEAAAPIWQRLYDAGKLPAAQMAYAAYFLAREAERTRQLEKAFLLGQEALSRLISQVERTPSAADVGKIQTQLASLMDVAESAGRLHDALRYGEQYLQYLAEDSPERQAVRYRMARVYKKLGDSQNWKRILEEIAAAAPGSVYGQLAASELKAASIAEDAAKYSPTGRL